LIKSEGLEEESLCSSEGNDALFGVLRGWRIGLTVGILKKTGHSDLFQDV
jgi:hypothetical protein